MTRPLHLEDFGAHSISATTPVSAMTDTGSNPPVPTEDDRLAAYESGYQSGWDDSSAAEAESRRRISADLANNLQDFRFTYEDARRDVLQALGPLFEDMAAHLLPTLAAEAIAPVVIAELQAIAEQASDAQATLLAAPTTLPVLEHLAETQPGLDLTLRPEPAFAEGQISIRFGKQRRDIDLTETAERMVAAIRAFVEGAQDKSAETYEGAA